MSTLPKPLFLHNNAFLSFLHHSNDSNQTPYALIVANSTHSKRFLLPLLKNAKLRIAADGGANRIFDTLRSPLEENGYMQSNHLNDNLMKPNPNQNSDLDEERFEFNYHPNYIIGDLDSIRDDVLRFYQIRKKEETIIKKDNDQNSTDLQKSLEICKLLIDSAQFSLIKTIIIYGALGGRFDQIIGNLNTLYDYTVHLNFNRLKSSNNEVTKSMVRLIMLSEGNLIEILLPGFNHQIQLNSHFEKIGETHCGLFPLCQPVENVVTKGLKWNLSNQKMEYGRLISTSNLIDSEKVEIKNDGVLVWTTEFKASKSESV